MTSNFRLRNTSMLPIVPGTIDHNALLNYVEDHHIDWTTTDRDFETTGSVRSDIVRVNSTDDYTAHYRITGLNTDGNTEYILTNWTTIKSGLDVNYDPVTGVFAPDNGVYSLILIATRLPGSGNETDVGMRIVDDLMQTVFVNSGEMNNVFSNLVNVGPDIPALPASGVKCCHVCFNFTDLRTYTFRIASSQSNREYNLDLLIARIM